MSEKMTAAYLRFHANASPYKLRDIIKNQIFVNDDVQYLKRLVKDVGGMDYVFRFLWYDGLVPVSNNGKKSQPVSAAQYGRTWIEYCCYYNAHQCLQWIFQEITKNHLCKAQQYRKQELDKKLADISSNTDTSTTDAKEIDEDHSKVLNVIKNLLEFPSISYCGTNYVAIATLRNSYQCLSLLIEYGDLDPSMPINSHGSTAAHLAAWKDHVECLQVLQSASYACTCDSEESNTEMSIRGPTSGKNDKVLQEADVPHRHLKRHLPWKAKTWSADWNKQNSLGETPMHVAAKEGCEKSMQFFLDLAITAATISMNKENNCKESVPTIDFSLRDNDGMDCVAVAAKRDQANIITLISRSIECLLDQSLDVPDDLPPPFSPESDILGKPLSCSPQTLGTMAPPHRLRTNSETVDFYSSEDTLGTIRKPPQASLPSNYHQYCLPLFFPTLNLRNNLEERNHEMPIHVAARYGNCSAIEALIKSNNCDVTSRDSFGQSAVHVALLEGRLDACQLFIHLANDQFKKFDVVDSLGRTPLYIACLMGNSSLARSLISLSDWRIFCHEQKQPPLFAAVVNDDVNTVSVLLDCGVDVDQVDADGRSALSIAAKLGHVQMCKTLILHGANVNYRSSKGKYVGYYPRLDVENVCEVFDCNSLVDFAILGGHTPYQKAKKYKHQEVANLLHQFGGR